MHPLEVFWSQSEIECDKVIPGGFGNKDEGAYKLNRVMISSSQKGTAIPPGMTSYGKPFKIACLCSNSLPPKGAFILASLGIGGQKLALLQLAQRCRPMHNDATMNAPWQWCVAHIFAKLSAKACAPTDWLVRTQKQRRLLATSAYCVIGVSSLSEKRSLIEIGISEIHTSFLLWLCQRNILSLAC